MNHVPVSYGELIAVRYRECASPLANKISGAIQSVGTASGIPQDDLAFIADHVSLNNELSHNIRDTHGRLDEKCVPYGREAAVDKLLSGRLDPCPDRRFSVIITHDVDRTSLCECTAIAKLFMGTSPRKLRSAISSFSTFRSAIAETIDELLRFEADNNIRSIFFFLSGPYSLARYGSRASITWSSARGIIRAIKDAGMEIGLHGSYYAMDKGSYADECRRLADAVQSPIRHHRNHYLRYDPKYFWEQLSEAGIMFDHSVGFTSGWGLRTGTCIPYPVYNFLTEAMSDIIEVPMLLMDGEWTLQFNRANMDSIRALLETVQKHRGCISINFHPESLVSNPTVWEYFKQIVAVCKKLGADMLLSANSP
jgi:hypothetical protein